MNIAISRRRDQEVIISPLQSPRASSQFSHRKTVILATNIQWISRSSAIMKLHLWLENTNKKMESVQFAVGHCIDLVSGSGSCNSLFSAQFKNAQLENYLGAIG